MTELTEECCIINDTIKKVIFILLKEKQNLIISQIIGSHKETLKKCLKPKKINKLLIFDS